MQQLNVCTSELIEIGTNAMNDQGVGKFSNLKGVGKDAKGKKSPAAKASVAGGADFLPLIEELQENETFFVDFMRDDEYDEDGILVAEAPKVYELGGTIDELRSRVELFLGRYNDQFPAKQMNIIMFDDALRHVLRISRCLGMRKGNILLVGIGGSGKQSLTKLASYCMAYNCFQITIHKTYNMNNLLDDIRVMYRACGQTGKKTTFLFTEAEIKDESFMEVINSILTTGEVPNLIPKEELMGMAGELRSLALKQVPNFVDTPDNLVKFFVDRVRSNLHVVLCMSPVNAKFPERARRFPGITGGCTIDWFLPWPKEALIAVSKGFIEHMTIDCTPTVMESLIVHMGMAHKIAVDVCDEYFAKMRRQVYQTPKSFLQFLSDFSAMYAQKSTDIKVKASRVEIGLEKLKSGAMDVEKMKVVLAEEEIKLQVTILLLFSSPHTPSYPLNFTHPIDTASVLTLTEINILTN